MSNNVKTLIKSIDVSPDIYRKDRFIRAHRNELLSVNHSRSGLVFSQFRYINKVVWIVSFCVLMLVIALVYPYEDLAMKIIPVLMPFVSSVSVIETNRSHQYKMFEIESATRYSLSTVLFSRISSIGMVHFIVLLILMLLLGGYTAYGYISVGLLITIPYLVTSIICCEVERTELVRKNAYYSLVISAIISSFFLLIQNKFILMITDQQLMMCLISLILIVINVVDIFRILNRSKEYGIESRPFN